jgi:hypothetical protein
MAASITKKLTRKSLGAFARTPYFIIGAIYQIAWQVDKSPRPKLTRR